MNSISKIGVTLAENNCVPINLEITEVNGPGTTARLDIEGILPSNPLWNTWEWQVNPDWIFNADNSNWTTSQVGSLDFSLIGDDTSVRVKFTIGSCIYYSNVSGMYDHPSYDCPTIELFINPVEPSAHEHPVLHITGLLPSNTGWDTWVWQVAGRFDVNGDEVLTPIWLNAQTGGLEFNAMGDDNIVRVKLQIGNCVYYSNESGYEKPNPSNKYYAKANIVDTAVTGVGILNISNVLNLGNGFNIDPTTDRITNVSGTIQYVQVTISLGARVDDSFSLFVSKNGVEIPNFKIVHEIPSSVVTLSFTDIIILNNNEYLTFEYNCLDTDNIYGNIIVETINSYINIP